MRLGILIDMVRWPPIPEAYPGQHYPVLIVEDSQTHDTGILDTLPVTLICSSPHIAHLCCNGKKNGWIKHPSFFALARG
jgi:hypothetical protein